MQSCFAPPDDIEAGSRTRQFTWRTALRSKRMRGFSVFVLIIASCQLLLVYLWSRPLPQVPVVTNIKNEVNWSRFAYAQYTTEETYLCNALMIFETLERLQTKPDRILMYPNHWSMDTTPPDTIARMLLKARDEFNVKLRPISVLRESKDSTWGASFTKLLAFNQTDYQRVMSIDSDSTILQSMDELFLLPSAPVAMPRAYWLKPEDNILSSQLVLIEPSESEFLRINKAIKEKKEQEFDMEIVNNLYKHNCFVLPHRPYNLISGEFRGNNHSRYLGSDTEAWDAEEVLAEAKLLHFSDWPYPKPWIKASDMETRERMPKCHVGLNGENDCRAQKVWLWLYEDFRERRKGVCGVDVL